LLIATALKPRPPERQCNRQTAPLAAGYTSECASWLESFAKGFRRNSTCPARKNRDEATGSMSKILTTCWVLPCRFDDVNVGPRRADPRHVLPRVGPIRLTVRPPVVNRLIEPFFDVVDHRPRSTSRRIALTDKTVWIIRRRLCLC